MIHQKSCYLLLFRRSSREVIRLNRQQQQQQQQILLLRCCCTSILCQHKTQQQQQRLQNQQQQLQQCNTYGNTNNHNNNSNSNRILWYRRSFTTTSDTELMSTMTKTTTTMETMAVDSNTVEEEEDIRISNSLSVISTDTIDATSTTSNHDNTTMTDSNDKTIENDNNDRNDIDMNNETSLVPELQTWYNVTKNIPIEYILPIGLGNVNENANNAGFFGDKRLNMEISFILRNSNHQYNHTIQDMDHNTNATSDVPEVDNKIETKVGVDGEEETTTTSSTTTTTTTTIGSNNIDTPSSFPTLEMATNIQRIAMSNQLLAQYIHVILPYHLNYNHNHNTSTSTTTSIQLQLQQLQQYGNILKRIQQNSQINDAGTMIEATVDYIATNLLQQQISTSSSTNNDVGENNEDNIVITSEMINTALSELAQFLVQKAILLQKEEQEKEKADKNDHSNENDTNNSNNESSMNSGHPKYKLKQYGGIVASKRLEGYPDHLPQFTATAMINDISATVHYGRNKREAETSAASMVLRYYESQMKKDTSTEFNDNNSSSMDDIENPKGRIQSIGGIVTSEQLRGHPVHLPRFKGNCKKSFFIIHPKTKSSSSTDNNNNVDDENQKSKYTIEASAEGRTKYEAERIASIIVWQHVMNMSTIPTSENTNPMLIPFTTKEMEKRKRIKGTTATTTGGEGQWFDDMDENDPLFDNIQADDNVVIEEPRLSAKKRRQLRTLANKERHVSKFDIRDTQDNFLDFKLEERPHINLRPGGETVIESWYRGALNPLSAFHRALIAPHVFPNHLGTVNSFTRHNILPDDENEDNHDEIDNNNINEKSSRNKKDDDDDESNVFTYVGERTIINKMNESADSSDTSQKTKKKRSKRTFTVIGFVVPSLSHPLVANLKDYNSNELMTKIFIEHGLNVRETRNQLGIKMNEYIINVLLKNYENLDEILEKQKKQNEMAMIGAGMSRSERKKIFFKF